MPTQHSHWLDARMSQARVVVLLNGARLGSTQPAGTQDVTMRLRPGINTLTVLYTPQNERSWASVTLTEGERGAGGAALASFREAPLAEQALSDEARQARLRPTSRTITFTAR
jgi:hypothetical protein